MTLACHHHPLPIITLSIVRDITYRMHASPHSTSDAQFEYLSLLDNTIFGLPSSDHLCETHTSIHARI